jgi:hypothetical protein
MGRYDENVDVFLNLLGGCDDKSKRIIHKLLLDMYDVHGDAIEKKCVNALLEDRYIKGLMNGSLLKHSV